jgi:CheY-like chemotaxis protein
VAVDRGGNGGTPPAGPALNVLVFVRDEDERELIRQMLLRPGCDVATSLDEVEEVDSFDVLITEVDPMFDRRSIAARLRAGRPELPVLFITGWFDHPDFADLDCERILQKPFSRSALARAIDAIVGAGRSRDLDT